jgi:hypothetical protein
MSTGGRYDDAAIIEASEVVMSRLIDRQVEVTQAVRRRLATEIGELHEDPGLVQLLGASVEGNVDTVFHALRHEIPLDKVEPPTAALEYSRRLAQRGVPMNALVRAYRLGHQLVLDYVVDELDNAGLEPGMSLAVFVRMTPVTFRYIDWISQQVVVAYERERDRWLENRDSMRAMRVREVLESADTDSDAITAAIRYPIRRIHLALVLWLPADDGGDELDRLERFLRELGESLAAPASPLFVPTDRVSGWGWIPLHPDAVATAVSDIRRFVAKHDDAPFVAVGSPLPGVDGFRRSHRKAQRARDVAVAAGSGAAQVTAVTDPGLSAAAMLAGSLDDAREWVHEVLGQLASNTDNDARLRETLRVFLRHSCGYKSAADELNLHFNTVRYRVHKAIERRGRPIDDDRLDVEIALLICHWLGAAVLDLSP